MKYVMVPGSRRLTFTFENGNTESYDLNNLEGTIFKQITRKCKDEVNCDLIEARALKCNEDLWRKSAWMGNIEQGVGGTTNLAMLRGGDSKGGASILTEEKGWVYPCALQNIHETISKISDPRSVLLKQASGKVIPDTFRLKDMKLRYESGEITETAQSIEHM